MNEQQIQSWRKILSTKLGLYVLIMPKEQIEAIRDRMQEDINIISELYVKEPMQKTICDCDTTKYSKTTHKDGRVTCNKCGLPRCENIE